MQIKIMIRTHIATHHKALRFFNLAELCEVCIIDAATDTTMDCYRSWSLDTKSSQEHVPNAFCLSPAAQGDHTLHMLAGMQNACKKFVCSGFARQSICNAYKKTSVT